MKAFILTFSLLMANYMMVEAQFEVATFANYERYSADNEAVKQRKEKPQVVFMGNSITQNWASMRPEFFDQNNFVGRGIGGQVTHQMLLRFHADVITLQPKQVVIMAGTNDIAQNAGPVSLEVIMDNLKAMAELAIQNDIAVILCSVPPAIEFPWRPAIKPVDSIMSLNAMIRDYAARNQIPYVDFFAVLRDEQNGMKVPEYTGPDDLVHPNANAYRVMEATILPIIQRQAEEN